MRCSQGRPTGGEATVGETPRLHYVCRCIPNCEIVFSVIAVSIYAFLPMLSHSGLLLISLNPFPLSPAPQAFPWPTRTCSGTRGVYNQPPFCIVYASPNFSLSLTRIDSPLEYVGVQTFFSHYGTEKKQKKQNDNKNNIK